MVPVPIPDVAQGLPALRTGGHVGLALPAHYVAPEWNHKIRKTDMAV